MSAPQRVHGIECTNCGRRFAEFQEFDDHDCDGDDDDPRREVPA